MNNYSLISCIYYFSGKHNELKWNWKKVTKMNEKWWFSKFGGLKNTKISQVYPRGNFSTPEVNFTCPCMGKQIYHAWTWDYSSQRGLTFLLWYNFFETQSGRVSWTNFNTYIYRERLNVKRSLFGLSNHIIS